MPATRYYLPCTCGKEHLVESRLAGATITCSCGKSLDVPALRGLKNLRPYSEPGENAAAPLAGKAEPAAQHKQAPRQTQKPKPVRATGCLFFACLISTLLSAAAASAMLLMLLRIDTTFTMEHDIKAGNEVIDRLSIEQVYGEWKIWSAMTLGTPNPPPYIRNLMMAKRVRTALILFASVAAISLLATLATGVADARQRRKSTN